jgi:2-polyprenyl-6-methoxyphenol hydroxylase-like FAD-dependent oxidoreductase
MIAAYVLAGELGKDAGESLDGLLRYEQLLRPFMSSKQKAAAQFARSFAPRTRIGVLLHNQLTRAFAIPFVAKLVLGRSLLDQLDLPEYCFSKARIPLEAREPVE